MSFTTRFVTGKNMGVLPRVMLQNLLQILNKAGKN